jgi:hypothetical protein
MSTISKVRKKNSLENHKTIPFKIDKNISFNIQQTVITNPIKLSRVSKNLKNNLNISSVIKTGFVVLGTIGAYYFIKTLNISPYFRGRIKTKNLKDTNNNEIIKIKNEKNILSVRTNLETENQFNDLSLNQIEQTYKDDKIIKFEEIKVEEFENLANIKKESVINRRSFDIKSISVKNPIPNQNIAIGKQFNLTIDGSNIFTFNSTLFLETTNIPNWLTSTNPNPTLKGLWDSYGDLAVSDNCAYIASDRGLEIIDISDSSNPRLKGLYSYSTSDIIYEVISSNYAYLTFFSSKKLKIIDISDPSNPTFKGSYNTPGYADEIALSGNYVYIANDFSGLQIIDISDPSNPRFAGSYNISYSYIYDISIAGNYAYIACNEGLEILDIRDPVNPTFKGSYNTPDWALEVVISENYAFIPTGYSESYLFIIDISDPANPKFIDSYELLTSSRGVAISGDYAYVADSLRGLQIIDISDPSNPKFKSSYDTNGNADEIALFDNYAYVGVYLMGLQIIDPNLDKVILSGTPSSAGTYRVDIKACNEAKECVVDSFKIIVKDLNITLIIISSVAGVICIGSVCCTLIGSGIIALNRYRKKILKDSKNIEENRKLLINEDKRPKFLSTM